MTETILAVGALLGGGGAAWVISAMLTRRGDSEKNRTADWSAYGASLETRIDKLTESNALVTARVDTLTRDMDSMRSELTDAEDDRRAWERHARDCREVIAVHAATLMPTPPARIADAL